MNQSDITNTTGTDISAGIQSKYLFALDRVKKLSAAIYAVTDLISSVDPLRQSLRTKSLSLLTDIFALHRNIRSKLQLKDSIKSSLEEMVALIELASFAKFISEMNSIVLISEYKKLLGIVSETDDILISLSETKIPVVSEIQKDKSGMIEGHLKKTNSVSESKMSFITNDHSKKTFTLRPADQVLNKKVNLGENRDTKKYYRESLHSPVKKEKNKKDEKNERKETIVRLFQKGLLLSIKDIAGKVQGYSEKTVQRELNDLVEGGTLTRIGEKRWSKYTLK